MAANRLTDLLALSHVPRWSIVRHVSPQNVGDHTFRVMVIYTELMNRLNLIISTYALQTILEHEASECRTGDIPSLAKPNMAIGNENKWCPWKKDYGLTDFESGTIKLADEIEVTTFIVANGIGVHALSVATNCATRTDDRANSILSPEQMMVYRTLVQDIITENGR